MEMFKYSKARQVNKQTTSITQFSGLDTFNSPINVSDNMAVDMNNMMIIDNEMQKRIALKNVFRYENAKIIGLYTLVDSKNNKVNLLCYYYEDETKDINGNVIDIKKYNRIEQIIELPNDDNGYSYLWGEDYEFTSNKPMTAVVNNNILYFTDGEDYKRILINEDGSLELEKSADFAYVPLVTSSVCEISNDTLRYSNEQFNLLSDYVRVSGKTHSMGQEYYDKVANGEEEKDYYSYNLGTEVNVINENNVLSLQYFSFNAISKQAINPTSLEYFYDKIKSQLDLFELKLNNKTYNLTFLGELGFKKGFQQVYLAFVIDKNTDKYAYIYNDKLIFTFDPENELGSGFDNWELKFEHYVEGAKEKIIDCTIMQEYSTSVTTTLFISGNENHKNIDWHTENGDYTYFGDLNYCAYGNQNSAINGYCIMPDNTMAVMKEQSVNDKSLYFRTSQTESSYYGTTLLVKEYFPLSQGSAGEGLYAKEQIVSFGNDIVFIGKNCIYGLEIASISSVNVKYAYNRSLFIDKELKQYDLSKARLFVREHNLYLLLDDGICYVADYKYKTEVNGIYQYVWCRLDYTNLVEETSFDNSAFMFTLNDVDYLVINNNIYCDNSKEYVDKKIVAYTRSIGIGQTNIITINVPEQYKYYEELYINSRSSENVIYSKIFDVVDVIRLRNIIIISEEQNRVPDDVDMDISDYIDTIIGDEYECYVYSNKGNKIMICTLTKLSKGIYVVSNVKNINGTVASYTVDIDDLFLEKIPEKVKIKKVEGTDNTYMLVGGLYKDYYTTKVTGSSYYTYTVTLEENVCCYYITKPFNFGSNLYNKCIYSLTFTNTFHENCSYELGMSIRGQEKTLFNKSGDKSDRDKIDFSNLFFSKILFDERLGESVVTIPCNIRNVSFIRFMYKNDDITNCILRDLSISYSYGLKNRGER